MKNKNGITLIALVVTIIVLLILAGVTISLVVGQNGIVGKANVAKVKQDAASVLEQLQLKAFDLDIDGYIQGGYVDKVQQLKAEGYIDSGNRINMQKLLGSNISTGNGTGTSDVYKIEQTQEGYNLVYYDEKGVASVIDMIAKMEYTAEEYFEFDEATGTISLKNSDSYYDYNYVENPFTDKETPLKEYIIPPTYQGKKVEKIGKFKAKGIETIVIPEGVTRIEASKFSFMPLLKSVILPNSVSVIENGAFRKCTALENITMSNVEEIGDSAFDGCTSLKNITLPDSITTIGNYGFAGTGLEQIEIPKGITTIGGAVFGGCKDLKNVTLPDTLTTIQLVAFSNCSSLTKIIIPSSVTTIEGRVFEECTNLTNIYCEAPSKPAGWVSNWNEGTTATVTWGYTGI